MSNRLLICVLGFAICFANGVYQWKADVEHQKKQEANKNDVGNP